MNIAEFESAPLERNFFCFLKKFFRTNMINKNINRNMFHKSLSRNILIIISVIIIKFIHFACINRDKRYNSEISSSYFY